MDAGLETIEVDLPAVITVDLRLNEPRYVKLPDIIKAKKKPLDTLELAALGIAPRPQLQGRALCAAAGARQGRDGQGRGRTGHAPWSAKGLIK